MKKLIPIAVCVVFVITVLAITFHPVFAQNSDTVNTACEAGGCSTDIEQVNDGIPYFTEDELTVSAYVRFRELDSLDRAVGADACLGPETLPTERRATRMSFKPTGWHSVTYEDVIAEEYLYNRCHLIAFCLCGDEGSPENLITGTAWLNIELMLPREKEIVRYIERTGNHVMYRVTPVYYGDDLVAYGVLIEALSVEDTGAGISICELLYNVQPGIEIDYNSGESRRMCQDSA